MNSQLVLLHKNKEQSVEKSVLKSLPRIFVDTQNEQLLPERQKIISDEVLKELFKEKLLQEEMFNDVVKRSQTVLFRTSTVFPFDIFPDELIVDLTKVTLITRNFFLSGQTQSVYLKDIMDVVVETGPFFSTLRIIDPEFAQNKFEVNHLNRKSAAEARRIIEALISACKAGVDLTKIGRREMVSHLPELADSQKTPSP